MMNHYAVRVTRRTPRGVFINDRIVKAAHSFDAWDGAAEAAPDTPLTALRVEVALVGQGDPTLPAPVGTRGRHFWTAEQVERYVAGYTAGRALTAPVGDVAFLGYLDRKTEDAHLIESDRVYRAGELVP